MCVVATYVIMHVIVYFGVCKCHGCSSHLCKWMFNLVMQACPYRVNYPFALSVVHVLSFALRCELCSVLPLVRAHRLVP